MRRVSLLIACLMIGCVKRPLVTVAAPPDSLGGSIEPAIYQQPSYPSPLAATEPDVQEKLNILKSHIEDLEANQEVFEAVIVGLEARISQLEDLTKPLTHPKVAGQ